MSLSGLAQSKCDITKMLKNGSARLWEEHFLPFKACGCHSGLAVIRKKRSEGSCKEI
jgi:hypothetical protein